MTLWSLLLPFKWFIIGVGEVLSGIFYLLKRITFFIGSLFVNLYEGIITVVKGIVLSLKVVFKYLFLIVKWLIVNILSLFVTVFKLLKAIIFAIAKGLFIIFKKIYTLLKSLFIYIFKAIFFILKNAIILLKKVCVYAFKVIFFILKKILLFFKKVCIYVFQVIFFILKNIFIGLTTLIELIYKALKIIIKYLFIAIKAIFVYIGRALKLVLLDVLVKYLFILLKILFQAFSKIPIIIWNGLKAIGYGLYKIFVYPFVYLYKNVGRIMSDTIKKIKNAIKEAIKYIAALPKKGIDAVVAWFNNLSFIKDIRNRREMKRQALLIDFDAEDAVRSEKKLMYHYVAKNGETGKIEKGNLAAFSKLDVHSYLLAEGYEVYEIAVLKGLNMHIGGGTHKVNVSELVFFLTQLSTYIKSGIPLVDSIKILGKQSRKRNVRDLYKSIIYDLTMGDSFSEALEKQGESFPRLLVNMVKSAELAGNLAETLDDMGDYYTSVSQTRKQMKSAMTYPTVILVFALSVVVFILTFVIPSFIKMYKDADAEVPALTTAIINLSDFLVNNAHWIALGLVGLITALYFMYKNVKVFRLIVQWILMHLPVIGKIMIYNEVTMFAKTFASLWNHNVFITSSMEILSKITGNEIYKMLIFDAITNVARGETVSASFKNQWAFPIVAYEMLLTGERTGQPGPMMEKVAQFYQEEHRNAINQVKAFIEPALIIFLAVVVGVILLSVVLPMFGIYGQLGLDSAGTGSM